MLSNNNIEQNQIKIEGIIYNIDDFRKIHPGGQHFIEAFSGLDATLGFNSYHSFRFPHSKMKQYYVSGIYTDNYDYLYDKLKSSITQQIKYKYADYTTWLKIWFLLISTFTLEYYCYSNKYPNILIIILGWLYALIGLNIQHDANHGALSKKPYINRLFGLTQDYIGGSSIDWIIHHIVYHHQYTNQLDMDPDIEPGIMIRLHDKFTQLYIHKKQHIYIWILLLFYGIQEVFKSINNLLYLQYCSDKFPFPKYYSKYTYLSLFFKLWFIYRWIYLPDSLITFCILSTTAGSYLSLFFIISHNFYSVKTYTRLDHKNFLIQQLESSSSINSKLLSFINGGLNYQIEHHLFPGYSHTNYHKISAILKEFCIKHKLKYNGFNYLTDNLVSTSKRLFYLGN